MKATLRLKSIELGHQQGGLAPFRQCHRRQRAAVAALVAFHLDELRDLLAVLAEEIAPHRPALRLDV